MKFHWSKRRWFLNYVLCLVTQTKYKLLVTGFDAQTTVILFLLNGQYTNSGVTKQWPDLTLHVFVHGLWAKMVFTYWNVAYKKNLTIAVEDFCFLACQDKSIYSLTPWVCWTLPKNISKEDSYMESILSSQ